MSQRHPSEDVVNPPSGHHYRLAPWRAGRARRIPRHESSDCSHCEGQGGNRKRMRCVIALANRGAGLCMSTMRPTPVFLLRYWSAEEPINVGTGEDIGIAELTDTIARVVGFRAASRSTCQSPTARPGKRSTLPGCSRSGGARRSVSIRESARPIDAFARRAEPVARSSEPDRQKTRAMEQIPRVRAPRGHSSGFYRSGCVYRLAGLRRSPSAMQQCWRANAHRVPN